MVSPTDGAGWVGSMAGAVPEPVVEVVAVLESLGPLPLVAAVDQLALVAAVEAVPAVDRVPCVCRLALLG